LSGAATWRPFLLSVSLREDFRRNVEIKKRNMKYLTIEKIQAQLRLTDEQVELERDFLTDLGDGAEEMVMNACARSYENIMEEYGRVPQSLVNATKMLVALGYQQREVVSQQNMYAVPYSFELAVKPYMRLADNSETNNNNGYGRQHCNF